MTRPVVTPVASYRFQLAPEDGSRLDDVVASLDHLGALGVSHVYLSPVAEAVPGSAHGYDVVDHTRVRAELGGAEALDRVLDGAARRGMAVVIDHVPNHVSVARPELQRHWWATLRDGPGSPSARWFDVDRDLADGRVVLPVAPGPVRPDRHGDVQGLAVRGDRLVVGDGYELPLATRTGDGSPAEVHEAQHYRVVYWRDATRNVRRFFTIDDLVAVQVEHEEVADEVDTLPTHWAGRPGFGGLRIDHVDGLTDPLGYLRRLRARVGDTAWLVVEKILAPDEWLPDAWPVDGTTGYETTRLVDHVLVDPAGREPLDRLWRWVAGDDATYDAIEDRARREVLDGGLRPDLDRTVRAAVVALGAADHGTSDEEFHELVGRAVVELTVALPRYRTYLPDDPAGADVLRRAVEVAAAAGGPEVAEVVRRLGRAVVDPADEAQTAFRDRWQRLTSPAMAKGAEDRAFFRYLRLASLCEVGGEPGAYGVSAADVHEQALEVQRRWPRTMVAGSTHDAKRSADVRARSTALTWHAEDWAVRCQAWLPRLMALGVAAVDASHALQTVATCPGLDGERLASFLHKAAREAEVRTSWTDPDHEYESALTAVAEALCTAHGIGGEVAAWAHRLDTDGTEQALASLALRLMLPGVPDLYQGAEAYSFRLTDPDNRMPPDRDAMADLVRRAAAMDLPTAWREAHDVSRAVVITRLLGVRRRFPAAFGPAAAYVPLEVRGAAADRVVAFERRPSTGTDRDPDARPVVVVVRTWPSSAERREEPDRVRTDDLEVRVPAGTWCDVLVDGDPGVVAGVPDGFVPLTALLGDRPITVRTG